MLKNTSDVFYFRRGKQVIVALGIGLASTFCSFDTEASGRGKGGKLTLNLDPSRLSPAATITVGKSAEHYDSMAKMKAQTDEMQKATLAQELMKKSSEVHQGSIDWMALWHYVSDVVGAVEYLEAASHGSGKTISELVQAIKDVNTHGRFGYEENLQDTSVKLHLFSALQSLKTDLEKSGNDQKQVAVLSRLLKPVTTLNAQRYLSYIQKNLTEGMETEFSQDVQSTAELMLTLLPDFLDSPAIKSAPLKNDFTYLHSVLTQLGLPAPDIASLGAGSGTYSDFVTAFPGMSASDIKLKKAHVVTLVLMMDLPGASENLKNEDGLQKAFGHYFTRKWQQLKKFQMDRKNIAIMVLDNFLENPLSPEPLNPAGFSQEASLATAISLPEPVFNPCNPQVMGIMRTISAQWADIGRELQVSLNERDSLRRDVSLSTEERLERILLSWKTNQGRDATLETLIQSMKNYGNKVIVEKLTALKMAGSAQEKYYKLTEKNKYYVYQALSDISYKWEDLASHLKLSHNFRESLKGQYRSSGSKLELVIHKCFESETSNTLKDFISALEFMECQQFIPKVTEAFKQ